MDAIYKTKVGLEECADDSKCVTAFRNSLRFTIALLLYLFHFVPFLCFGFFCLMTKLNTKGRSWCAFPFLSSFFPFFSIKRSCWTWWRFHREEKWRSLRLFLVCLFVWRFIGEKGRHLRDFFLWPFRFVCLPS